MSDELIIKHCSPTLAGMKTGNTVACRYSTVDEMRNAVRRLNMQLRKKGLRFLPCRYQNNRALIYVYRPARLLRDLQSEPACKLLCKLGYIADTPQQCVVQLVKRMSTCEEFPHEIGLFLGYPPEDVCGFIENRDDDCKCVGCWKVYGDAEAAQKTFAKYKKCIDVYSAQYANGKSIERLTVVS